MSERPYIVTFRESAIVTERVVASNAREAIERVKVGEGERLAFEVDESRWPAAFVASRERSNQPEASDA